MQNHLLAVLQQYPHWVCYELPDKAPKQIANPEFGASVNEPTQWATWDAALNFMRTKATANMGVGFVLTPEIGLTCVDLDNKENDQILAERQAKIFNELMPTAYAELSPSGNGCHLWMFGQVDENRKTKGIEVYSHSRYITFTGNPIRNVELTNLQPQINDLIEALDRQNPRKDNKEIADSIILERCAGEKFAALWAGQWQGLYPSQSEADSALVYYLARESNDYRQIERLFYASQLGQRDKAHDRDDYLSNIIKDAMRDKAPILDKDTKYTLQLEWAKKQAQIERQEQMVPSEVVHWPQPPGLTGEIATFIYQNAIYPNIEVALAGALAFLAGIAGRAFNTPTGTGLNQYIVLVGGTSQGKEAAARGVSVLSEAVSASYKAFELFMGPAGIASPQGLIRRFEDSKSFVARIGEFGHWMQKINAKHANVNDTGIRQMLLDIFTKSGSGDILPGSVYADRAKNVPNIKAPALTILGDTTPEEFYKSINEANIAEGLVSRFSIITVPLVKPDYNQYANKIVPSAELIERICKLGKICIERMASDQAVIVDETQAAHEYQLAYQKHIANIVWEGEKNGEKSSQIWHRAHLRLLRTGALLAVSENPDKPVVELRHYEWARLFVDRGCQAVIGKFNAGEVGISNTHYEMRKDVELVLKQFTSLENTPAVHKSWQVNERMIANQVINRRVIQLRIMPKRSYKEDSNSANTLNNILRDMEQEGILVALPETNAINPSNGANYYTASGHPSKARYWGIDITVLKK